MKTYDFSKGKRGRVSKPESEPAGKTRITIRLDDDSIDHFMAERTNPVEGSVIKP